MTNDGGEIWQLNNDLDTQSFFNYTSKPLLEFQDSGTDSTLNSVYFINTSTGWAAGEDGIILTTNYAGSTWTPQASGINETILDIQFVDDKAGWAAGIHGTILQTVDAGVTWGKEIAG